MHRSMPGPLSEAPQTFLIGESRISLPHLLRGTTETLERYFGVYDLSLIEKAHLRHVVMTTASKIEEEWAIQKEGQLRKSRIAQVTLEAAWTWLHQVCGIPYWTLYAETAVMGNCSWEFCLLLRRIRADSHLI